jgi:hypothetical protein
MTPRFWTCALVTNLSAFVRLTYAVAAMSAETGDGGGADIYDLSQSVALIVVAITCTAMRSRIALGTTAFFATLLQFFDGIVGLLTQDPTMKYWPIVLAFINAISLAWMYAENSPNKPPESE